MAELYTYSPEDVIILLAGIIPVDGYVDGTFVSIKKNLQPFSSKTSTDGVVSRLYNNDQTYTITLTLANYSSTNNVLSKLWIADEITQRAKFPVLIKDTSGSSLFAATTCWIESIPETSYSKEIESRVWTIYACQATYTIGGNSSDTNLIEDLANAISGSLPAIGKLFNG